MTTTPAQREAFLQDVMEAQEELYLNMAHLDKKECLDNIVYILHALRIAAMTYNEYPLQKSVENSLALLINHNMKYDSQTVDRLYDLAEEMVYPYRTGFMLLV